MTENKIELTDEQRRFASQMAELLAAQIVFQAQSQASMILAAANRQAVEVIAGVQDDP